MKPVNLTQALPAAEAGEPSSARTNPPPNRASVAIDRWLFAFILLEISCQLLLSVAGGEQPVRIAVRAVAIGAGLAFILLVPGSLRLPSLLPWLLATITILSLGLLHPETEGIVSGLAQVLLYVSVLSPLLWVPRLSITPQTLRRVLGLFWAFHFASTVIGILQVVLPGSFQTALSSSVAAAGEDALQALMVTLNDGTRVLRPTGLTDVPGGASASGMYSVIFGAAFFIRSKRLWTRALFALSMTAGVACIAICQIRALAVVVAIAITTLGLLLLRTGRLRQLMIIGAAVGVAVLVGSALALGVASQQVQNHFDSFFEDRPEEIYATNRGVFLEQTFTEYIPEYPLGAGLGRWGMMYYYFNTGDTRQPPLYAELQLTAWIFDGGLPLLLAYCGLLLATLWAVYRVIFESSDAELTTWAIFILSYDVGLIGLIFSYPLFVGQLGLEFWLFNAALLTGAGPKAFAINRVRSGRRRPDRYVRSTQESGV
jgi:hypothetical protein